MTRRARASASSRASELPGHHRRLPVLGHARHRRRQLLPGHPGPDDLRDRRPDHDGDARPGRSGHRRHVHRPVKVSLSAADTGTNAAGVEKTEYRITTNGTAGDWKTLNNSAGDSPFVNSVTSRSSGTHLVEFRSTDKAANTEATKSVTFKVQLPVCDRSDEFDGTDILPRWVRHTRNGGTPTTGPLAPTVSGGQLHLPTNDLEIDAADGDDLGRPDQLPRPGPARAGHELDRGDAVHRPFTGGWQNVGLVVWNGDNNFFRSTITHNLGSSAIFVESSKDAPSTTEGARTGGSSTNSPADQHRSGDDQDALHARRERQHGDGAVPDRRAGLRGDGRLGQLPEHHRWPGPQPERWRPS